MWRFHLRPDATFHDGTPVTAAAFALAFDLAAQRERERPGAGYHVREILGYAEVVAGSTDHLAGVQAADDHTLVVTLSGPRADWPTVAGHPALGPVHPDRWAADPNAYAEAPVGNGPFQMTEAWAHGQFIRTARFDEWRNGDAPAQLAEVLFQIADVDTNYLAFRQGRRDLTAVPPEAVDAAAEEFPHRGADSAAGTGLLTTALPSSYLIGFDLDQPPTDQLAVRRSVMHAVDRDRIAAEIGFDNLVPARGLIPPPVPGARPAPCTACTFDLDLAAVGFAATGVTQLEYAFNAGGGHEAVRDRLRDALADAGVGLVSNRRRATPDFATFRQWVLDGEVTMFRLSWAPEYPSTDEALYPLLHSSQVPEHGGQNYGRYADADVDALLDQARRTLDEDARTALYQRAERVALNRDHAVVPVVTYRAHWVAADRVRGLRYSPWGLVDLAVVSVTG